MKKRVLAGFVLLCLLFSLLAVPAAAAGEAPSWTLTTLDGQTLTQDTFRDRIQVLLFVYADPESYSYSGLITQGFATAPWIGRDELQVIVADAADYSSEDVAAFRARWAGGCKDILFAANGDDLMWQIFSGSLSFPACAILQDGAVVENWSGIHSFSECTEKLAAYADLSDPVINIGEGEFLNSGAIGRSMPTREEAAAILRAAPLALPSLDSEVFDELPSVSAPYAPGQVKAPILQAAADRLSALRLLAGLPGVTLDADLSVEAQYGAVLLAASSFGHYPPQPADMDDAFYERGKAATSSSNIAGGYDLTHSVDGFMDDSDAYNIDRLGHRRWQLNPKLGKVGFGYVRAETTMYRRYADEKIMDKSGEGVDYAFIGWPASGNFPSSLTNEGLGWSVTLNPARYSTPVLEEISVTLTRESDGFTWTFDNSEEYALASEGRFFTVETSGYGVNNCIIFRPDEPGDYEGVYTVTIDGVKDSTGKPVRFAYQVDFFDPDALPLPTGHTVSGQALGWNDADDAVYLLYKADTSASAILDEWRNGSFANSAEVLYTGAKSAADEPAPAGMTAQGFRFADVADGNYQLAIFKPGKYVPEILPIAIAGGDLSLGSVQLWLYGDVTGDGEITMQDVMQINRRVVGLSSAFDEGTEREQLDRLAAGNVTALTAGDDKLNAQDVMQICRYLAELGSAFDVMK